MKKLLLLICLPFVINSQTTTYHRSSITKAPVLLRGPVSFAIGPSFYVGLGKGDFAPVQNKEFYRYDTVSNTWTAPAAIATYPGPGNNYANGFSIGGLGYVVGGYVDANPDVYHTDLYEYDPSTNAWTQKAAFPGPARAGGACFVINNKAYYGLGYAGSTIFSDLYEYDPANNTWTQKTAFPGASRAGVSSFAIGAKGYVVAGEGAGITTIELWEYDQANDSWLQKTGPTTQGTRTSGVGFELKGKGYYGYGYQFPTGTISDLHEYNPLTDSWKIVYNPSNYSSTTVFAASGVAVTIGPAAYFGMGMQYNNDTDDRMWELKTTVTGNPAPPNTTSIDEVNKNYCNLYPNPAQDKLVLDCNKEIYSYRILDFAGKEISSAKRVSDLRYIALDYYAPGLYLILLTNSDQQVTVEKFLIVK